jgi:thiamine pyrophosphokinase
MPRMTPPSIELCGRSRRSRRSARAAVLALTGATAGDLRTALACAAPYDGDALLIAVDGGLTTCRAVKRRRDLFVGDLDSAAAAPKGVRARIYPAAKSFSDFAGALAEARRLGADVAVVAGLLGGRLDHEWANLLEMGAAAKHFAGLLAPGRRGLVIVTARGLRASALGGRLVSVFALGAAARVSLRGTRWTLANRPLAPGSRGLSNVTGDALELDVHAGVVALVLPAARA